MANASYHYYAVYKPFGVLSQFHAEAGKRCLKDFFPVPPDVYPVGRLDLDSEGLLLLTNDRRVNHRLLDPAQAHRRQYLVQVEGIPDDAALRKLESGLPIRIPSGLYRTLPCKARCIPEPPSLPDRHPPIRVRKSIPTGWLQLQLTEGKNRQVRKMTAAVGFPTLRLIRTRMEDLDLEGLQPGQMRAYTAETFYQKLHLGCPD